MKQQLYTRSIIGVFCPNAGAGVCASADLCDTMLVLFFAQGAKQSLLRLGSFFALSSKLFPHLLTSRKHSSLALWSGSDIPWMLTEALVAELGVCVALDWSLYEI